MNSDYLKREKIREAITSRLLQLSRQCEDVCGNNFSRNSNTNRPETDTESATESVDSIQVTLGDDTSSDAVSRTKNDLRISDKMSQVMINNFISPRTSPASDSQDKAFYKDYVPNSYSISRNCSKNENEDQRLFTSVLPEFLSPQQDESRLFMATPSTDLELYIAESEDTDHSPSLMSSESDLTLSEQSGSDHETIVSVTESFSSKNESESLVSQSDPVTVVSLSSDDIDSIPKILNNFEKIAIDNEHLVESSCDIETRTSRRRRLSYTLEEPSPVLQKMLQSRRIGPENNKNNNERCLLNMQDDLDVRTETVLYRRTCTPVSPPDRLHVPANQRKPLLNTNESVNAPTEPVLKRIRTPSPPNVQLRVSEGPKWMHAKTPSPVKSRIPVISSVGRQNVSSILHGPDQQFSNLEMKNKVLKQYLDGATMKPSPQHNLKLQECSPHSCTHSQQLLTTLGSGIQSLQTELCSVREETSQQRHLLEELVEQLQRLNSKQDTMVQQIVSSHRQQMAALQQEISREIQMLFAQKNRATEIMLRSIENRVEVLGQARVQSSPEPVSDVVDQPSTKKVAWNLEDDQECPSMWQEERDQETSTVPNLQNLELNAKFNRISAAVKGYLTRRLMKTEKVQGLIKTIKDALDCALKIHEMANEKAEITKDDAELHQRLIIQVTSACYEFHNIFFKYSMEERMNLIAQSRQLARERTFKVSRSQAPGPYISSATMKALERKKMGMSKSVSPNSGRRKLKPPKRSSTAMDFSKPVISPRRLSLQSPIKESSLTPRKSRGDRSPSFYM